VEDDIEEGTVDVQPAVVVDEPQSVEHILEETDAGPRGADHLGQRFLTDLRNDRLRLAFFPKSGPARTLAPSPSTDSFCVLSRKDQRALQRDSHDSVS